MDQRSCKKCRKRSFTRDDDTGALICNSCGIIQDFDNYEAQLGGISGTQGTFIRAGTSGSGTFYNYKEKKLLEAQRQIDDFLSSLEFSVSKSDEVKEMISKITDGEFGLGNWFPILIGACSYAVMRKCSRSLSMAEVATALGCDIHELGRMINRVVQFLDLKLPEFDLVSLFEHSIRISSHFKDISKETIRVIMEQGLFLLQCGVKWFLTTGRRPLPLVAAVIVFVAEMNRVDAKIEDVANELNAMISTSKARYKELLEALVMVAQALPWGVNVTTKNIMTNAPFVLKYMEMKSRGNNSGKMNNLEGSRFDMEEVVSACLSKEIQYGTYSKVDYESQYYEIKNKRGRFELNVASSEKLMISYESLPTGNAKFVDKVRSLKEKGESGANCGRKRNIYKTQTCNDLWNGNSTLSKKLSLTQILEKDVGMDGVPPSYLSGCLNNEIRREKIKAAKLRINKIMNPPNGESDIEGNNLFSKSVHDRRRQRRKPVGDMEWEGLVIETLLLHQVKEEEIEKGHYKALLDLHVFNSAVILSSFLLEL